MAAAVGQALSPSRGTYATTYQFPAGVVQDTQDRVLLLQLFIFSVHAIPGQKGQGNVSINAFSASSYPAIGEASAVMDTLCCNSSRTGQPFASPGQSFALLNGAFRPIIRLQVRLSLPDAGNTTSTPKYVPHSHTLLRYFLILYMRGRHCYRMAMWCITRVHRYNGMLARQ